MAKIYTEDAYCLGLLYSYMYANKRMVLKDDLELFYKTIEKNLKDTDAMDIYATLYYDNDDSIYFPSLDKNKKLYYVLYPDFDIKKAKSKYIGCLSTNVLVASQKENALNCLGLQLINGNIREKNDEMTNSYEFMTQFIKKLNDGELKIEKSPQDAETEEFSQEFIIRKLEEYQRLLESEMTNKVIKDDIGSIKKLTLEKK